MRLSVIVPAYNEEARVGDLIRLLLTSLEPLRDGYEIVVVDDGSQDATAERVAETGVTLLRHERNAGKAAAVQTGLRRVQGDLRRRAGRGPGVLSGRPHPHARAGGRWG